MHYESTGAQYRYVQPESKRPNKKYEHTESRQFYPYVRSAQCYCTFDKNQPYVNTLKLNLRLQPKKIKVYM